MYPAGFGQRSLSSVEEGRHHGKVRDSTRHLSFCFLDILGIYLVWFGFLLLSCKVIVLD